MAFTNTYDVTFPPNTQAASQGAADMQEIQLNVQQRMAAISGVSTAMPNFAGDAQPANWNGILFFATDNGHIYQFSNPTWVDVTAAFLSGNVPPQVNGTPVTNTGNTTNNTIFTLNTVGGAGLNTQWRITFSFDISSGFGGNFTLSLLFGGTSILNPNFMLSSVITGMATVTGGNKGTVSSQSWDTLGITNSSTNPVNIYPNNSSSAINTSSSVAVVLKCQNEASGNSITFNRMILETL